MQIKRLGLKLKDIIQDIDITEVSSKLLIDDSIKGQAYSNTDVEYRVKIGRPVDVLNKANNNDVGNTEEKKKENKETQTGPISKTNNLVGDLNKSNDSEDASKSEDVDGKDDVIHTKNKETPTRPDSKPNNIVGDLNTDIDHDITGSSNSDDLNEKKVAASTNPQENEEKNENSNASPISNSNDLVDDLNNHYNDLPSVHHVNDSNKATFKHIGGSNVGDNDGNQDQERGIKRMASQVGFPNEMSFSRNSGSGNCCTF